MQATFYHRIFQSNRNFKFTFIVAAGRLWIVLILLLDFQLIINITALLFILK
jgi:hypothetical protein